MPKKESKGPKAEKSRKLIALSCRPAGGSTEWQIETMEITGFIVNNAGALTLFNGGAPIRAFAPGYWTEIALLGEQNPTQVP
jgi:hypothetical protein